MFELFSFNLNGIYNFGLNIVLKINKFQVFNYIKKIFPNLKYDIVV